MGDILSVKSGRMQIKTLSAQQTVKYALKARGTTALEYFKRNDILHDPVNPELCRYMSTASRRYREELDVINKEKESKRQKLAVKKRKIESKEKAKERLKAAQDVARAAHKKKMMKMVKRCKKRK